MPELSVCCVTRGDPHVGPFLLKMRQLADRVGGEFVIGADGTSAEHIGKLYADKIVPVKSKGYIESVLEEVFSECSGNYIFRLDDDEVASPALVRWITSTEFSSPTYTFFRLNLWQDENHYIKDIHPDGQTRLTRKDSSMWTDDIHSISPCGFGVEVLKAILHYKFLIKTLKDRKEIARRYESIKPGAGSGDYEIFSIPENSKIPLTIANINDIRGVVYED